MAATCCKCGATSESEFYPSQFNGHRHGVYCKRCHREYYQNRAKEMRGFWSQYQRERRHRYGSMLREIKTERGCEVCGEKHPACLEFHHRDPQAKKFTLTAGVAKQVALARLLAEVDKCSVLCSNCHRKLHWPSRGNPLYPGQRNEA